MGRESFIIYCASCHGVSGRGDGPVAPALASPPPDLTAIAARANGVFDGAEVATFVDGRKRIAAHGTSDMPVWGRRFDDRVQEGVYDETRLRPGTIFLIVEYLLSIQAVE
jgi:mono/diheme cytochrome c family protein